jgi:trans-2,3-dihydro-3-hydroxyanthranilate isomerase
VRIFTPKEELPLAGHPTLGTAYVIREEIIKKPVERVVLNLKIGQISVTFNPDGIVWMPQKPPTFGRTFKPEALSHVLGIEADAIDGRFPIEEVSTGVFFIIV